MHVSLQYLPGIMRFPNVSLVGYGSIGSYELFSLFYYVAQLTERREPLLGFTVAKIVEIIQ